MRRRVRLPRDAVLVVRNFAADRCLDQSAAIAYYSLLSLGPSLYLLSVALGWFLPEASATGTALSGAAALVPPALAPIVVRLEESLRLGDALVVVALPGLLWTASSAFLSLEYAVNVAFRTAERRRFFRSRLKAFLGASVAAVLLVASATTTQAAAWIGRQRAELGLTPGIGTGATSMLLHLAATFGAFAALFKILPRGRVGWGAASIAASASLAMWEGARRVFGGLLERSPAFGLVTGSLAGIVAFLLWVYTAVALLLFGAELAAVLNGNRDPQP